MTKTAIGYLRQSVGRERDDRDGGSVSTAFQLAAIDKWCATNDTKLIAWYQDVDESGASRNRKGLDEFTSAIGLHRPDYAVMWDVKRLARNLRLFLDVFDALEETRTDLVSCTEGTRHPGFVWKMLALMAEEERDRIALNITHGKREATKRGRHLGYPPLGYVRGDDGILRIDEATAWIVRWLFDRAIEGHSATAICRLANERGLPTSGTIKARAAESHDREAESHTITQWSRATVEAALRRPTYAGLVQSGAKARSRHGRSVQPVTAEGVHPAIIDRATWEAVQRSLDGNGHDSRPRGSWHWLKGRVTCAACGAPLYYVDAARSDKTYRDRYWRCRRSYAGTFGRAHAERCPSPKPRISDAALTGIVLDALRRSLAGVTDAEAVMRRLQAREGVETVSRREQIERELADVQAQRVQIMQAIQAGIGIMAEWGKRDKELIARVDALSAELAAVPVPTPITAVAAAVAALHALRDELATAEPTPEQWAILAARFSLRVTVDPAQQTVALAYREPFASALG